LWKYCLAHIPIDYLVEGWIINTRNTPDNNKLKYFMIIGLYSDWKIQQFQEEYGIVIRHRTNNIIKGWNSRLNKI